MRAFVIAVDPQAPIDCDALYAAQARIQQLLTENCPIVRAESK